MQAESNQAMSQRILIIDDEEHIRRVIRITLEAAGYIVGEAGDGNEGLRVFGDGSAWDAVILDQRMPGIDGLEVLRRMKERTRGAKVIMATAYASIEIAVDAMKLGASDFVRKPMTPEMLRNAVAAALDKQPVAEIQTVPTQRTTGYTIRTITMNGFTVLDEDETTLSGAKRTFTILSPGGTRSKVVVEITPAVLDQVSRMTKRELSVSSSFWTEEARRLVGDYLWSHGELPKDYRLALEEVSRNKLFLAERWQD